MTFKPCCHVFCQHIQSIKIDKLLKVKDLNLFVFRIESSAKKRMYLHTFLENAVFEMQVADYQALTARVYITINVVM